MLWDIGCECLNSQFMLRVFVISLDEVRSSLFICFLKEDISPPLSILLPSFHLTVAYDPSSAKGQVQSLG